MTITTSEYDHKESTQQQLENARNQISKVLNNNAMIVMLNKVK